MPRSLARVFARAHGAAAEIGDESALAMALRDIYGDEGREEGLESENGGDGSDAAAPPRQPSAAGGGGAAAAPSAARRRSSNFRGAPARRPSTRPIHWETLHAGDDKLTDEVGRALAVCHMNGRPRRLAVERHCGRVRWGALAVPHQDCAGAFYRHISACRGSEPGAAGRWSHLRLPWLGTR